MLFLNGVAKIAFSIETTKIFENLFYLYPKNSTFGLKYCRYVRQHRNHTHL